jgi:hypothetical protein
MAPSASADANPWPSSLFLSSYDPIESSTGAGEAAADTMRPSAPNGDPLRSDQDESGTRADKASDGTIRPPTPNGDPPRSGSHPDESRTGAGEASDGIMRPPASNGDSSRSGSHPDESRTGAGEASDNTIRPLASNGGSSYSDSHPDEFRTGANEASDDTMRRPTPIDDPLRSGSYLAESGTGAGGASADVMDPPPLIDDRLPSFNDPTKSGTGASKADQVTSDDDSVFTEAPEWNFMLPNITAPKELTPGGEDGSGPSSLRDLIGAVQHGAGYDKVQNYLGYYDRKIVSKNINGSLEGFPAMFYAVATNNDWIVRTWVNYGGDVNAVEKSTGIPVLVFAIINSENIQNETTLTVATLLSIGAKATSYRELSVLRSAKTFLVMVQMMTRTNLVAKIGIGVLLQFEHSLEEF